LRGIFYATKRAPVEKLIPSQFGRGRFVNCADTLFHAQHRTKLLAGVVMANKAEWLAASRTPLAVKISAVRRVIVGFEQWKEAFVAF
jgi:hypothetical protein